MKEKYSFKPGDKIFAKVKGFVYWPARVNPIPEEVVIPPGKIPIFFFGTHEVYFISSSSCWPYDEKTKAKWGKPRARAHFNEGMEEIENNPTLFQYGADPNGEVYLAQFYDFKRTDGNVKTSLKKEPKREVLKTSKSKKDVMKTKNVVDKKEKNFIDEDISENVRDLSKKEEPTNDFKIEDQPITEEDRAISPMVPSDDSNDRKYMPKLRSKSRSSIKKTVKRKLTVVQSEDSDEGSDSEAVSSDNPNDEDFRPSRKVARVSSVRKNEPKPTKTVKPKAASNSTSKTSKPRMKKEKATTKTKKSKEIVMDDDDSLSSISSIEDWQEKDEKRRKEHEEMLIVVRKEELIKEELAIKEASRQLRKKSHSQSALTDESKEEVKAGMEENDEVKVNEIYKDDIAEVLLTEDGSGDKPAVEVTESDNKTNIESVEEIDDETIEKEVFIKRARRSEIKKKSVKSTKKERGTTKNEKSTNNRKRKFLESDESGKEDNEVDNKIDEGCVEENKEQIVQEKESKMPVEEDLSGKKSARKRIITIKKEICATNKENSTNIRKRRLLDSDESDEEELEEEVVERDTKKVRLSHMMEVDSDNEETNAKSSDAVVEVENNNDETASVKPVVFDKIKALQSYNNDIRLSLVLGHEDYDKCLNRFQSLCTMDIDLVSLVTVWQLMDTVKKCRRYKRHEPVKNEAQNVYKRFVDIYSHSSATEVIKAQEILAQTRNNSGTGLKNESTMNGHSQNPTMPVSVDDMFHHNKPQGAHIRHIKTPPPLDSVQETQSTVSKENEIINKEEEKISKDEEKINKDEEKMRLLSVDLEAKVSDILNKIEKNSGANSINRKSMSHLLPARTDESVIQLPVQWESVNNTNNKQDRISRDKEKINDMSDDDDEEDEEAIVKRIDNISIKAVDLIEDITMSSGGSSTITTSTVAIDNSSSALDTRIENLFKDNNVSGGSKIRKSVHGTTVRGVSGRHNVASTHGGASHKMTNTSLLTTDTTINASSTATIVEEDTSIVGTITTSDNTRESKTADNVIYDLLGV